MVTYDTPLAIGVLLGKVKRNGEYEYLRK